MDEKIWSLSRPSKMPGYAWGISARKCPTGSKLAKISGTICNDCYALKGRYRFGAVAKAHEERLKRYLNDPEGWVEAMVKELSTVPVSKPGYFRWFDSGDLQSEEMLRHIIEVCSRTPHLKHWLPTKEYRLIRPLDPKEVPDNLVIRVSAPKIDGEPPKWWPLTSGVNRHAPPKGHECPAKKQGGVCGSCRACWNTTVNHITYPHH